MVPGHLYVIQAESESVDFAKVGITKNLDRRKSELERAINKAHGPTRVWLTKSWPCYLSTAGYVEDKLLNGHLLSREYRLPEVEATGWGGSTEVFPTAKLREVITLIDSFDIKPPEHRDAPRIAQEHLDALRDRQVYRQRINEDN